MNGNRNLGFKMNGNDHEITDKCVSLCDVV